jgi:hypothetical protein
LDGPQTRVTYATGLKRSAGLDQRVVRNAR